MSKKNYVKSFELYESERLEAQSLNESINEAKSWGSDWAQFEVKGKKLIVKFAEDTTITEREISLASKMQNDPLLDDIEESLKSNHTKHDINWDAKVKLIENGNGLEFVLESEDISEGNDFSEARQKAIDNDKDEFEVDGKKYKVTGKKDKDDKVDEAKKPVEEGNAFTAARQKAIDDGKDEFEVDGETYKVKGDKDSKPMDESEWADIDAMELNERNAFLGARAKAIQEDQDEFEFNGKKFKVTTKTKKVNEDTLNEGKDKPMTKKVWDKLSDDERVEKLLSVFEDPNDAEDNAEKSWDQLPDEATANMTI